MGATFVAYKEVGQTQDNIAYSAVQRFRFYMLEYAGRHFEGADDWAARFEEIVYCAEDRTKDYKDLMDEVYNTVYAVDDGKKDIIYGIEAFCNHPDCEGSWDADSCADIAMVLDLILGERDSNDQPYITHQPDRKRLMEMQGVFSSVGKGGMVRIG